MNEALHLFKKNKTTITNHVITHLVLTNEQPIQLFRSEKNERKQ